MSTSPAPLPQSADPEAWGRVAAVLRSLRWLSAAPERVGQNPWAGPSAARALTLVAAGSEPELAERLNAVVDTLQGLSDREPHEAVQVLEQVLLDLEQLVPLGQIGGRSLAAQPMARLLPERKRRRRGPKGGGADAAEGTEKPSEGEAEQADSAPAEFDEGSTEADSASVAETPAAEGELPPVADAGEEEESDSGELDRVISDAIAKLRAEGSRSKPAPPAATPSRHHLDHPRRGGLALSELDDVDEELVEQLAAHGIETVGQLIARSPVGHDRSPLVPVGKEADEGASYTFRGRMITRCVRLGPGGSRRWELVLGGREDARLVFRWLGGEPRGFHTWQSDQELALVGELHSAEEGDVVYEAEPVGLDGRGSGWMPRYGLEDVDDLELRELMALALTGLQGQLKDFLPGAILDRHRLLPLDEALRDAHFPSNSSGRGRVRMAFEELLLLQVGVAWSAGRGQAARGTAHKALHGGLGKVGILHNIHLDDAQEIAFSDIRRDLASNTPMTRLLQGEVGTAKNLIALMTAVVVAENRSQVAMVAPDALAAERRFLFAENILRSIGIVPMLVQGPVDRAQADAIRRGEAHVVFGTHDLLEPSVDWKRLGLVVVEERGPYGTVSSTSLTRGKAPRADLLVVTRAPIPTSLALSVFGDFDVSVVPVLAPPRVKSVVVTAEERKEAYEAVREQLELGRQAFVVFPVRGGQDLLSPEDAVNMARALNADAFPDARIGIYCSPMSRDERHRVYDDFLHRRLDVLVCTTHIEDAPLVANGTAMVVEYADMHQLTRLHQLRAHVGFGTRQGSCHFILSDKPAASAVEMVEKVVEERDGFRLAEYDLLHRGAEALLAERAEEAPEFVWSDPPQDRQLLLRARTEAFRLIGGDPRLKRHGPLARAVRGRWGHWLAEPPPAPEQSKKKPGNAGRRRRRRRRRR